MTEQQEHLTSALNNQKELVKEIQELNNTLSYKKEQFIKLQGVVDYLTQLGVKLEEPTQNAEEGNQ
jgi:cbb3-type cytochrome oxidase cytochrome c subunit